MKKKLFFSAILVCLLVLNFVGCDMENTGYQLEYYKITSSTYSNRPSDATNQEQLSYAKNAAGTGSKGTYWSSSFDGLKDKLLEITGALSVSNDIVSSINGQHITTVWYSPGLLSSKQDYWFFYIENNNK
jgi:hypothetical protein